MHTFQPQRKTAFSDMALYALWSRPVGSLLTTDISPSVPNFSLRSLLWMIPTLQSGFKEFTCGIRLIVHYGLILVSLARFGWRGFQDIVHQGFRNCNRATNGHTPHGGFSYLVAMIPKFHAPFNIYIMKRVSPRVRHAAVFYSPHRIYHSATCQTIQSSRPRRHTANARASDRTAFCRPVTSHACQRYILDPPMPSVCSCAQPLPTGFWPRSTAPICLGLPINPPSKSTLLPAPLKHDICSPLQRSSSPIIILLLRWRY